jgi:uncharacterized membrane protein HdeD (DUF308 family)
MKPEGEEIDMTTYDSSSRTSVGSLPAPPFWVCILLGIVMILAGFLVLGDVMLVTLISTIFIGWVSIIAGAFEVVHAFWTKGWGGFIWQVLLGIGISHWREAGWVLLLSGVFGIVAGFVILTGFPMTGLWVLGFLLGVDLISHGIGWLAYAWKPAIRSA